MTENANGIPATELLKLIIVDDRGSMSGHYGKNIFSQLPKTEEETLARNMKIFEEMTTGPKYGFPYPSGTQIPERTVANTKKEHTVRIHTPHGC